MNPAQHTQVIVGKRLGGWAFRFMYLPKEIPESQGDYLEGMDYRSLCEACLSLCYRVSALRKGDIKGGCSICLVTKDFRGIYYALYLLVSLPCN